MKTHRLPNDVRTTGGRMNVRWSNEAHEWIAYCPCDVWIGAELDWRAAMNRMWLHHFAAHQSSRLDVRYR